MVRFRIISIELLQTVMVDAGSDACAKVQDQLLKAWSVIEPNVEACGSAFFR